jgi:hypothetical protein
MGMRPQIGPEGRADLSSSLWITSTRTRCPLLAVRPPTRARLIGPFQFPEPNAGSSGRPTQSDIRGERLGVRMKAVATHRRGPDVERVVE